MTHHFENLLQNKKERYNESHGKKFRLLKVANPICFECNMSGHFKWDFQLLKNKKEGDEDKGKKEKAKFQRSF